MSAEELNATMFDYFTEAKQLRDGLPAMPDTHAAPYEVHDYLLDVRRRLDRVEHLLGAAARVRSAARGFATRAGYEADDEWDAAIVKINNRPVVREFSSARERAAEANLATLDARRRARESAAYLAIADDAVESLRLIHRGLDGVRHDTLTILRLVQFESHLER